MSVLEGVFFLLFSLPFLGVGLAALAGGVYVLYGAGKQLFGTAHAAVTEPVGPGSAPQGAHATITGEVLAGPDGTLAAPITGEEAVAHRYRLEQRTEEVGWWTVADDGHSTSFYIQGPTSRVLVDPDDEQPTVPIDDQVEVGATETLPAAARERFEQSDRFDLAETPQLLAEAVEEPRRYEESTVATGETVYVYGYVTDDGEPRVAAAESNEFRFSYDSPSGLTGEDSNAIKSVLGKVVLSLFLFVFGAMFAAGGGAAFLGGLEVLL